MRTVLSLLFCSVLAPAQPGRESLSGAWVDSQGNRLELSESDGVVKVTSKSWKFDVGSKEYNADLALSGVRTGNEFTAGQATTIGSVVLKARLAPSGSMRGTLAAPGETPIEMILVRAADVRPQVATAPARRIAVRTAGASTSLGGWIPVTVALEGADGRIVAPAEPVFIDLSAEGGTPLPGRVRVTPENPQAPAGIKVDTAEVTLKASAAGLPPTSLNAWGCADTPVTAIRISTRRSDAVADGKDALPLIAKFIDAAGAPSNNQARPKSLDWTVSGAVRRALADGQGISTDHAVGPRECVSLQEITSERPGQATVSARFAGFRDDVTLHFVAPLTAVVLGLALLGGIVGGLGSAAQNYGAAKRWKPGRWAASLFTAEVGALALFLAWHYGLVSRGANLPSGPGVAFLAGMIGGWAGGRVLGALSESVIPPQKTKTAGAA